VLVCDPPSHNNIDALPSLDAISVTTKISHPVNSILSCCQPTSAHVTNSWTHPDAGAVAEWIDHFDSYLLPLCYANFAATRAVLTNHCGQRDPHAWWGQ
jgi:hypothetical protein